MHENDKPVLVYSTFPSLDAAEAVGRELVERRLAACVNILPGMTSIYRWEGAIARDTEVVMIIKTRAGLADPTIAAVKALHTLHEPGAARRPDHRRIGRLPALARRGRPSEPAAQ